MTHATSGQILPHAPLLFQQVLGNQQRKIGIFMPRFLETRIELVLDQLPYPIAVLLDDHTALDLGIIDHIRHFDDVRIPPRKSSFCGVMCSTNPPVCFAIIVSFKYVLKLY